MNMNEINMGGAQPPQQPVDPVVPQPVVQQPQPTMDVDDGFVEVKRDVEIPFWEPQLLPEGQVVEGVNRIQGMIIDLQEHDQYGVWALIENKEGKKWKTKSHHDLQVKLKQLGVGNLVRITYVGEKEMGGGKSPMKEYVVHVKT